jgi:hypothetical protein
MTTKFPYAPGVEESTGVFPVTREVAASRVGLSPSAIRERGLLGDAG